MSVKTDPTNVAVLFVVIHLVVILVIASQAFRYMGIRSVLTKTNVSWVFMSAVPIQLASTVRVVTGIDKQNFHSR